MPSAWASLTSDLVNAFGETFLMVGISGFFALAGGLPLGFLLFIAERRLFWESQTAHALGSAAVNIIRSIPFVILLVLLLPLTQFVLGTTIGPAAAAVPLSVAAVAFYPKKSSSCPPPALSGPRIDTRCGGNPVMSGLVSTPGAAIRGH